MESIDYQQPTAVAAQQPASEGLIPMTPGLLSVAAARGPVGGPSSQSAIPLQSDASAWQREEGLKVSKRQPVYQEMVKLHEKLESDILLLENKIYEMEGNYLAATADVGNMLKGWEGYICRCCRSACCCPPGLSACWVLKE